ASTPKTFGTYRLNLSAICPAESRNKGRDRQRQKSRGYATKRRLLDVRCRAACGAKRTATRRFPTFVYARFERIAEIFCSIRALPVLTDAVEKVARCGRRIVIPSA